MVKIVSVVSDQGNGEYTLLVHQSRSKPGEADLPDDVGTLVVNNVSAIGETEAVALSDKWLSEGRKFICTAISSSGFPATDWLQGGRKVTCQAQAKGDPHHIYA